MESNDEGRSDPELIFSYALNFPHTQNGISETDSLIDVPPADYVGNFKIDSFRLHMPIIPPAPCLTSLPCTYLTLPLFHLKQPALFTNPMVGAVPRSSWSLSISSLTTNHQVEEEYTLLATRTASLTETLATDFNEVQRRGLRDDASGALLPPIRQQAQDPEKLPGCPEQGAGLIIGTSLLDLEFCNVCLFLRANWLRVLCFIKVLIPSLQRCESCHFSSEAASSFSIQF